MRSVILACAMSLDGYIARPDGSIDFIDHSAGSMGELQSLFAGIDAVIFGGKTFEAGKKLGPPPPGPWATYVFSRSQPQGIGEHGYNFVSEEPSPFIQRLKQSEGKDILLMGGGALARSFLQADLIDKFVLSLVPVLLGEGIPLFPAGFPERKLTFVESRASSGTISLTYVRKSPQTGQA